MRLTHYFKIALSHLAKHFNGLNAGFFHITWQGKAFEIPDFKSESTLIFANALISLKIIPLMNNQSSDCKCNLTFSFYVTHLLLSCILYSVSLHCHEERSPSVFQSHPQLVVGSLELHCPSSLSMMSLIIPLLWPSPPNHHHLFHKSKPLPSVGRIGEWKCLDQTLLPAFVRDSFILHTFIWAKHVQPNDY